MTIQAIGGGLWLPTPYPTASAGVPAFDTSTALSAAASRFAMVFQVPKTGTLDWFEVRYANVSNAPDNGLRFSFQDVDASGNPDNTEDQFAVAVAGFTSNTWAVPPGYMGASGTGSGAKRAVTQGDWLACCIRFESFVAGDNMAISTWSTTNQQGCPSPYFKFTSFSSDSGTNWTKAINAAIVIALRYDDGTYAVIGWPDMPGTTINTRTFNSGSTPDERGLLFQVPFPARMAGAWIRIDSDNAWDAVLYNSASSPIATQSYGARRIATTGQNGRVYFPASVDLAANSNYRLVVKPGASNVSIYDWDINAAALLEAIDGGTTWMSTQRTDAGAWTDTNTNRPFMGIILNGFDDAASSGGGEHSAVF